MRTLVVSDLHLGLRSGRDRLREPRVLAALSAAAGGVDRLVLLGDVIELRQDPVRDAVARARPVLERLGAGLGAAREVVLVPGNHDHHLLDGWLARRAAAAPPEPLGGEAAVDWREGEPLAALVAALGAGGASVRVAYPGVWLSQTVWATHGHYLDRHTTIPTFERLGAGAMARVLGRPPGEAAGAEDYEAVLTPIYAWLHAVAQAGMPAPGGHAVARAGMPALGGHAVARAGMPALGDHAVARTGMPAPGGHAEGASTQMWRRLGRGARRGGARQLALQGALAAAIGALNRAGLGPLRRELDGTALRRAPLMALAEVTRHLGVDAEHVIFGHTHRAGPLPADDTSEWLGSGARLLNVGCWVHEPAFLGSDPSHSPYRPGFVARLEDAGAPELVNLLG